MGKRHKKKEIIKYLYKNNLIQSIPLLTVQDIDNVKK